MSATRIDLSTPRGPCFPSPGGDIGPLYLYLAQLVGEPFQFVRASYADELTMHFGPLRESRSPKLKDRRYGSYVLSFRGSTWVIKSGPLPIIHGSSVPPAILPEDGGAVTDDTAGLETSGLITVGAAVVFANPFYWKSYDAIGVQIVFADGSLVMIQPSRQATDDDDYTELASWELLAPHGNLKVGLGGKWEFTPLKQAA